jgi:hypothetical protein
MAVGPSPQTREVLCLAGSRGQADTACARREGSGAAAPLLRGGTKARITRKPGAVLRPRRPGARGGDAGALPPEAPQCPGCPAPQRPQQHGPAGGGGGPGSLPARDASTAPPHVRPARARPREPAAPALKETARLFPFRARQGRWGRGESGVGGGSRRSCSWENVPVPSLRSGKRLLPNNSRDRLVRELPQITSLSAYSIHPHPAHLHSSCHVFHDTTSR